MAGSLKVTCTAGQQAYAYTTASTLTALNGATAWTISFFYQLESWDTGANGDLIQIGGVNPFHATTLAGNIQFFARNAGNTATVGKTVGLDTTGHHICISGSASGTSTIYIDGIANATTASLGALVASNSSLFYGWNDAGHAATLYLRDMAIWGAYSVSAAEALALAEGTYTPATLPLHSATNYWTLQGTEGAVTAGMDGLLDSLGSAPLNGVFGTGVLTYDAHEITSSPAVPVLFLTPYVDTTGYLLFVPFYLNALVTAGGPILPDSISTDPVFTVAGSTVVPTRLPLDALCAMAAYQFATPVTFGQAVTMAAPLGWASTAAGVVGGTSDSGLGGAPLACLNYAGTERDDPVVNPIYQPGYNIAHTGSSSEGPGQVMANLARRMGSWRGDGTVTALDANNLPASFTGPSVTAYIDGTADVNGIDGNGIPGFSGTLTLIHGDDTAGVTSDPSTGHVLQIDLITLSAGWTVEAATIEHAGDWDAAWNSGAGAWRRIAKTYRLTWSTSGGALNPKILVKIARTDGLGGAVSIPILANGMSELGIFEPSPTDPTVPLALDYDDTAAIDALFDPMAISPVWLARHAGAGVLRWMPNQALYTTTGGQDLTYPADLAIQPASAFLATNATTTTLNVTRIDPVGATTDVILDYLNGDATGTVPLTQIGLAWYHFAGFAIATIEAPHGIRTGEKFAIADEPTSVRALAHDSAYITLTAGIDASQTTIHLSATTNLDGDDASLLFAGYILQIGSGATDEQVQILTITGLDITVTRGARGTTAQTKPTGTTVYPCTGAHYGGFNEGGMAVSATELLLFLFTRAIPRTSPYPPTILHAQTYTLGAGPVFTKLVPSKPGSASYELCSRATSLVATANASGACICWSAVPFFATDALVTAIVNAQVPDFQANPGLRGIWQCSNEVFNSQFDTHQLAIVFGVFAPNPESSGTGFVDFYDYWASRQHQFNVLAKAAFTAAGLDPDRVIWYHNGTNQGSMSQSIMAATIAYCQRYGLPIESISTNAYADMGASMGPTYVSWLPASTGVTGATATWDLATARKVMMANYRASMRHGIVLAACYVDAAKSLSRYNHGISVDGSSPANTNAVRGRLCVYEGATTQPLPIPFPAIDPDDPNSHGTFPQCAAWTLAMQYDPEWRRTERTYFQALQDMPYQYALLMGAKFPDATDAIMEFGCYLAAEAISVPMDWDRAYAYAIYRWQQQLPGYGDGSHGGVVNRLDFWDPTAPVNHDITANGGILAPTINQSIRGRVALDWIAELAGGDSIGTCAVTEYRDTGAALSRDSFGGLSVLG